MGTCICLATRPTIWMHDRSPLESVVVSFYGPLSLRDEITGPRSCGPAHQQNQEGPPLRGWRVSSQHVRWQLALQSPWEGSDTWSGDSPKQHVSCHKPGDINIPCISFPQALWGNTLGKAQGQSRELWLFRWETCVQRLWVSVL